MGREGHGGRVTRSGREAEGEEGMSVFWAQRLRKGAGEMERRRTWIKTDGDSDRVKVRDSDGEGSSRTRAERGKDREGQRKGQRLRGERQRGSEAEGGRDREGQGKEIESRRQTDRRDGRERGKGGGRMQEVSNIAAIALCRK